MEIEKRIAFENIEYNGSYIEPSECPLCRHAIKPQLLHLRNYKDDLSHWYISGFYLCNHCYQTFVTLASANLVRDQYRSRYSTKQLYCGPSHFTERTFGSKLDEVSPRFVKIYNQAAAAESQGLDEICGIGYRKALEFLIKDYLIHKEPDHADEIKQTNLGKCINEKITDEDLKATALRCAWLGNDETHYIRKFEEYDLNVLKQFLEATIHWVTMKLTTEFAQAIESRH